MVFWEGTLGIAVGLFVLLALAEYSKYRQRRERAFRLLAASGFLLAASVAFSLPDVFNLGFNSFLQDILLFLGELAALGAVIFLVIDSLKDWGKEVKR